MGARPDPSANGVVVVPWGPELEEPWDRQLARAAGGSLVGPAGIRATCDGVTRITRVPVRGADGAPPQRRLGAGDRGLPPRASEGKVGAGAPVVEFLASPEAEAALAQAVVQAGRDADVANRPLPVGWGAAGAPSSSKWPPQRLESTRTLRVGRAETALGTRAAQGLRRPRGAAVEIGKATPASRPACTNGLPRAPPSASGEARNSTTRSTRSDLALTCSKAEDRDPQRRAVAGAARHPHLVPEPRVMRVTPSQVARIPAGPNEAPRQPRAPLPIPRFLELGTPRDDHNAVG